MRLHARTLAFPGAFHGWSVGRLDGWSVGQLIGQSMSKKVFFLGFLIHLRFTGYPSCVWVDLCVSKDLKEFMFIGGDGVKWVTKGH